MWCLLDSVRAWRPCFQRTPAPGSAPGVAARRLCGSACGRAGSADDASCLVLRCRRKRRAQCTIRTSVLSIDVAAMCVWPARACASRAWFGHRPALGYTGGAGGQQVLCGAGRAVVVTRLIALYCIIALLRKTRRYAPISTGLPQGSARNLRAHPSGR